MAVPDRPREKLARAGVEALGDAELVAVVLGTGTRAAGALDLALDLVASAGGTAHGLAQRGYEELCRHPGIGPTRAARLLAAVELGRRSLAAPPGRPRMRSSADVAALLAPRFSVHPVERFGVVLLDSRHRVIRTRLLFTGTVNGSLVHPRDVFREGVLASAAAVVAFHNHPSGDPSPSDEDRDLTARLRRAGEIMGIELADHIILGHGQYFSFRDEAR